MKVFQIPRCRLRVKRIESISIINFQHCFLISYQRRKYTYFKRNNFLEIGIFIDRCKNFSFLNNFQE